MKPLWISISPNAATRAEIETILQSYPNANVRFAHVDAGYWWTPTDTTIPQRAPYVNTADIDSDQILFPTLFRDQYMERALHAWKNYAEAQERNLSRGVLTAHYGGLIGLGPQQEDALILNINPGQDWYVKSDGRISEQNKIDLYESLRTTLDHIRSVRPDLTASVYYDCYGIGGRQSGASEYQGAEATALWVLDTIVNPENPDFGTINAGSIDSTPLFGEKSFYTSNQTWLNVFNNIGTNLTFSHQNLKPFGNNSEYATSWYAANVRPDVRMINNGDSIIFGNSNDGILGGIDFWKGFANQYGRLLKTLTNQNQFSPSNTSLSETKLRVVGMLESTYAGGYLNVDDPGSNIPVSLSYLRSQAEYLLLNENYNAVGFLISGNLDTPIGSSSITPRQQLEALLSVFQTQSSAPPPADPGYTESSELGQSLASDQLSVTYFKSLEHEDITPVFSYEGTSRPTLVPRQPSVCFPDVYYDEFGLYHGLNITTSRYATDLGNGEYSIPNVRLYTLASSSIVVVVFVDTNPVSILDQLNLIENSSESQQLRIEDDFLLIGNSSGTEFNIKGLYNIDSITRNQTTNEVQIIMRPADSIALQNTDLQNIFEWETTHPSGVGSYTLTPVDNIYKYTYTENNASSVSGLVTCDNLATPILEQTDSLSNTTQRLRITGVRDTLSRDTESLLYLDTVTNGDPRLDIRVGDLVRANETTEYRILGSYINSDLEVYFEID